MNLRPIFHPSFSIKIVFNLLFVVGTIGFVSSCYQPTPPKEFTGNELFKTPSPELLYFKNVRSAYYYKNRKLNSKMDIYTLRKLPKTDERPILFPTIINNWLKDESYIFIENGFYPFFSDTLNIKWIDQPNDTSGIYQLSSRRKELQYMFAGNIYQSLVKNHSIELQNNKGEWIPIFKNSTDKSAYLTTLKDYYKLTDNKARRE